MINANVIKRRTIKRMINDKRKNKINKNRNKKEN
jgi:hypothetical protein